MEKTTNDHLLPADTGPERAPILRESEGPVPAGKKTSPGVPAVDHRDPEVPERPVRRRFSAEYKLHIVRQADACGDEPGKVGELLRREGLYSSHLSTWRKHREQGTLDALSPKKRGRKPRDNDPLIEENRRLQRVNQRLVERLRQAEVIIDVQKKVAEILGIPLQSPEPGERDS
jgi:transposase